MVVAQGKTGKTTLGFNAAKALVDGRHFIGRIGVRPSVGNARFDLQLVRDRRAAKAIVRHVPSEDDEPLAVRLSSNGPPTAVPAWARWDYEPEVIALDQWRRSA